MDDGNTKTLIVVTFIAVIIIFIIVLVMALLANRNTSSSDDSGGQTCTAPPPPGGVTAVNFQTVNIRVNWSAVPNADAYRIYVGTVPGFNKSNAFATYIANGTEYIIRNLTLGRTYYIFVESIGVCGNISLSQSPTISVVLAFPARFQIVNRANPGLVLKIAPDLQNVVVDTPCSGVGVDTLCIWSYDAGTAHIVSEFSGNCMQTFLDSVDNRIKYDDCNSNTGQDYVLRRQWNYTPDVGSLCNPQTTQGLRCVKIDGPPIIGQSTIRVPFDQSDLMQWDIIEA